MGVKTHSIRELALISPAFWANKPVAARLAEACPIFQSILPHLGLQRPLVRDGYLANAAIAFGHELKGDQKQYFHPAAHQESISYIKRMFIEHPQIDSAVSGTSTNFLRRDLLYDIQTECQSWLLNHLEV